MMNWSMATREVLRPIWLQVESGDITDRKELEQIIRDAYPFGERKHSPYKTWLRHRKKLLTRFDQLNKTRPARQDAPLQTGLFGVRP